MEGTLADRLRVARSRAFVGRRAEQALFASMLSGAAGYHLLWITGPGGIGKSTLLQRLADEAGAAGLGVVSLDGASIPPTPSGVQGALTRQRSLLPAGLPAVVLVDELDALAPVEDWLRTRVLPDLPERYLVVLASRRPPGARWRADLGWGPELRTVRLGALEPADVADYVERRGGPSALLPEVLAQSQGHPLAMALATDLLARQDPGSAPGPLTAADRRHVVEVLVERFLDAVPDDEQRRALHVFGMARCTTVPLLRQTVGPEAADACFTWLAGLSFAELTPEGIVPHELARSVLEADLRWRDPDSREQLQESIRADARRRLLGATGPAQQRAAADLLWFHRENPLLAAHWSTTDSDGAWVDAAREEDVPAILVLVARHEGAASVQIHRAWWDAQPEAFQVVRTAGEPVRGFLVHPRVAAPSPTSSPEVADPVLVATRRLLARQGRLRAGEHGRVIRSWIGVDGYHVPSPTNRLLTASVAAQALTEPGLAVTVAYAVGAELWTPLYGYADYARAPDADAAVGDRQYTAFLHDWRISPPLEWLDLMDARLASGAGHGPQAMREAIEHAARHLDGAAASLSAEQFALAVRQAFRDALDPVALGRSPLLGSRVLRRRLTGVPPPEYTAAELRQLLADEVAALHARPRRETSARALELTYLTAVRTQEAVAMRMSLPFSTYRRHLASGLSEVTAELWRQEAGGV